MAPAFVGADAGATLYLPQDAGAMAADPDGEVGVDHATGHPAWVIRRGVRHTVAAIDAERNESHRRLWRVRLQSGERVLIVLRHADRRWSVTPSTPPYGPDAL